MADRSSPKKTRYAGKVWAVTLGCPKNRVDTEVMLGDLLSNGYAWTYEPEDADVVLVNTCGFLQSARQESLEVLGDIAALIRHTPSWLQQVAWSKASSNRFRTPFQGLMSLLG